MQDDKQPDTRAVRRPPGSLKGRVVGFAQRLEQTKVTVTTVLVFMVFLAVLSGAAAGIGYASHHFLRR